MNFETNYYKQTTTTTWWTTGTRWARAQRARANGTNPTLTLSSLLWAINGPQRCHPKSQFLSIFIPLFQVQPYFTAWVSSELWSDGRIGLRPVLHLCTLPTATSSNDAWEKTIFMNWLLSRDLVLGKRCFSIIHCPIKRFIIFCIGRWPEVSVDLYFVHQNTLGLLIFSTLRSPAVTKIYDLQVATHDTGGYIMFHCLAFRPFFKVRKTAKFCRLIMYYNHCSMLSVLALSSWPMYCEALPRFI